MNLDIITFILYSTIAINTTVLLGRSLYTNGAVFLESIFKAKPTIVEPLNKVLLAGFYLINMGFVMAYFSQKGEIKTGLECLEFLGTRLGTVYLLLGAMHVFNILVFMEMEKKFSNGSTKLF